MELLKQDVRRWPFCLALSFRNRSAQRKTPPCGGEFLNNIVELNRIELSAS
jgi:hypothetical protein